MATRSKASKQPQESALPPNLKVSRAEAAQQIQVHLDKGREIRERVINTEEDLEKAEADRSKWTDYSVTLLTYIFDNTSKAEEYRRKTTPIAIGGRLPLVEEKKFFKSFMDHRITLLESVLESLELIPELTKLQLTQSFQIENHLSAEIFLSYMVMMKQQKP